MNLPMEQQLGFNYRPQEYLHSAWVQRLPYAHLIPGLYAAGQCQEELSEYILKTFRVRSESCFDFQTPRGELVLLSNAELKEMLLRAGLLQCGRQIASLLMPKDIKQVRQQIGEQRYRWLMSRWQLLHENSLMPQISLDLADEQLKKKLLIAGVRGVSRYIQSLPVGFRNRLYMKLHPDLVDAIRSTNGGWPVFVGKFLISHSIKDIRSGTSVSGDAS